MGSSELPLRAASRPLARTQSAWPARRPCAEYFTLRTLSSGPTSSSTRERRRRRAARRRPHEQPPLQQHRTNPRVRAARRNRANPESNLETNPVSGIRGSGRKHESYSTQHFTLLLASTTSTRSAPPRVFATVEPESASASKATRDWPANIDRASPRQPGPTSPAPRIKRLRL